MELLPLGLVKLRRPTTTPNNNRYLMHSRLVTSPPHGVHKLHGRLTHGVSWLRSVMLMRRWPLRPVLDVGLVVVPLVHQLTYVAPLMLLLRRPPLLLLLRRPWAPQVC